MLSPQEITARDRALKASDVVTQREGRLWDEAWDAARAFYAPSWPEGYVPTATDIADGEMP